MTVTAARFLGVATDRNNERVLRERAERALARTAWERAADQVELQRRRDELARCRAARQSDAGYVARRVAERDAAQAIVWAVAEVRVWTNEDGRRFVFADDLSDAMGVPRG